MKTFFILFGTTAIAFLSNTATASEGTINFNNAGAGVNAPVANIVTGARVSAGDGLAAGLYYAADGESNENVFSFASSAVFLSGGSAGYFVGGTRVLPGTTTGSFAIVQVRVWETNYGGTYEAAAAAPAQNDAKQSSANPISSGCSSAAALPRRPTSLVWKVSPWTSSEADPCFPLMTLLSPKAATEW